MGSPWRPHGPDDLAEEQRARIRRQVLGSVRPLRRSFADRLDDRAYDVFVVLAVPAPHIVRALIALAVILSLVGGAGVASADAVPDEPLYGVKLASERVRLALARAPEDRASVQLSMAEHRLAEALRLIREGRDAEAVEVTSAYGAHLAGAAAELAAVERHSSASRPVVEQLKRRLAEQQRQASDLAARFVDEPAPPVGAQLLRSIASSAPALPTGSTESEGIAEHAASVTDRLAVVAEGLARAATPQEEGVKQEAARAPRDAPSRATPALMPPPTLPAQRSEAARAADPVDRAGAGAATLAVEGKKAEAARAAAAKAKQEADRARGAAERAKEEGKRTAAPGPTPRR